MKLKIYEKKSNPNENENLLDEYETDFRPFLKEKIAHKNTISEIVEIINLKDHLSIYVKINKLSNPQKVW